MVACITKDPLNTQFGSANYEGPGDSRASPLSLKRGPAFHVRSDQSVLTLGAMRLGPMDSCIPVTSVIIAMTASQLSSRSPD